MPQTAVVLGGGSDIACALLKQLASRRLERVVLVGRSSTSLTATEAELATLGVGQIETLEIDLADHETVEELATTSCERLGTVDLVLVAAGSLPPGAPKELDIHSMLGTIEDNFTGPAVAVLAFSRALQRQGFGQIVVLSSVAGYRVRAANLAYGAAKAGLDGFCQALQDALVGSGVSLLIVRPGFVRTKMTTGMKAAPFATDANAVASAVIRGLERGAEIVWSPPILRGVFGILRLVPRSIWRRIPG